MNKKLQKAALLLPVLMILIFLSVACEEDKELDKELEITRDAGEFVMADNEEYESELEHAAKVAAAQASESEKEADENTADDNTDDEDGSDNIIIDYIDREDESKTFDQELLKAKSVSLLVDYQDENAEWSALSVWEGLTGAADDYDFSTSFYSAENTEDFDKILTDAIAENHDLIIVIAADSQAALKEKAAAHPEQTFLLIDECYDEPAAENMAGLKFKTEEPAFILGYIAGYISESDRVGFISLEDCPASERYKYAYAAGAAYAAHEQAKSINFDSLKISSPEATGEAAEAAEKLYADGADTIFNAAGSAGEAILSAAENAGKYMLNIYYDRQDKTKGKGNVIAYALKTPADAVYDLVCRILSAEDVLAKNSFYGLQEGALAVESDSENEVFDEMLLAKTQELERQIINGEIHIPVNESEYNEFKLD